MRRSYKMSTFSFRLIKYTYRNRIQYDDGPGSFRHIVADESSHVRWERHNLPESFGTSQLEEQTKYHERELEYEENPVDRFTFHECAWCNTDFEGEGFLCEECDTRLMEMERESVRDLFRFRILSQDWWENIYYHLYWYWRGLTR